MYTTTNNRIFPLDDYEIKCSCLPLDHAQRDTRPASHICSCLLLVLHVSHIEKENGVL